MIYVQKLIFIACSKFKLVINAHTKKATLLLDKEEINYAKKLSLSSYRLILIHSF